MINWLYFLPQIWGRSCPGPSPRNCWHASGLWNHSIISVNRNNLSVSFFKSLYWFRNLVSCLPGIFRARDHEATSAVIHDYLYNSVHIWCLCLKKKSCFLISFNMYIHILWYCFRKLQHYFNHCILFQLQLRAWILEVKTSTPYGLH